VNFQKMALEAEGVSVATSTVVVKGTAFEEKSVIAYASASIHG